jgi:hypothetical protein
MYFYVQNQAEMIYVNYGRGEDFEYLLKHNISCKGKIVIVRYGENFRGDKVNRWPCRLLINMCMQQTKLGPQYNRIEQYCAANIISSCQ